MTKETEKKKFKARYVLIPGLLIFLGGIFTGIGLLFSSFLPFGDPIDLDRLWTGNYVIFGTIGFMFFIFMPTMIFSITRKRNSLLSSFQLSKIGPYAPGYKAKTAIKKAKFCEYCGYQVHANERECPECGGPIRAIKSSYIT